MASRYRNHAKAKRDPGRFVALPCSVLDSAAYQALSYAAKALSLEVARQYHSDDNGRMLPSFRHLKPRGWPSPEVIQRAKRELLDAELIFETVKGARPNKASWYAVTWQILDRHPGYDPGTEAAFQRGAYKLVGGVKNAFLNTVSVLRKPPIDTESVLGGAPTSTETVPIRHRFGMPPTTETVHPLEKPSPGRLCAEGAEAHLYRWQDDGGANNGHETATVAGYEREETKETAGGAPAFNGGRT
jgi:hypothetical protein